MSHHTRGILLHVAAGLAACGAMFLLLPGARAWHAPAPVFNHLTFQSLHEAMNAARSDGNVGLLQVFYAPGFRDMEVELPDGEWQSLRMEKVLPMLITQQHELTLAALLPPDAWRRVVAYTPSFEFKRTPEDEGRPYRHRILWSWTGDTWRIVQHTFVPLQ